MTSTSLMHQFQQSFPIIGEHYQPEAVVLCNGDYPSATVPLQILAHAPFVCCCDDAAENYLRHGHRPDAIIGDGDSLPQAIKEQYADLWHQVSEQDDNDQTKATRFLMANGFKRLCYLGATGKREDHTLGNISLMARYTMEFGLSPVMVTDHGYFLVAHGDAIFATFPSQQVSIFNLSCTRLESLGLRWPSFPYQQLWQGTLNEATGHEICFKADGTYIVYLTHLPKV